MTAICRLDKIANVPGIPFDVLSKACPQIDSPNLASRIEINHAEEVGRHFVNRMRRYRIELKAQRTIDERMTF